MTVLALTETRLEPTNNLTELNMKICPNDPEHKTFRTSVTECHDWKVDGSGNFIEDLGCTEVLHKPHTGNVWECVECGAEAIEGVENV